MGKNNAIELAGRDEIVQYEMSLERAEAGRRRLRGRFDAWMDSSMGALSMATPLIILVAGATRVLARVLLGLLQPNRGQVLYDGQCLKGLDVQALRQQFGVVTQHTPLFAGSIRSNIAINAPQLGLPRMIEPARCFHNWCTGK